MVELNLCEYLKAEDIPDRGVDVVFLTEGKYVKNQFDKENFEISVEVNKGQKTWSVNRTSLKTLSALFGNDTKAWIGKSASLIKAPVFIDGKQKTAVFVKLT